MIELHFLNVGHGDCTIVKWDEASGDRIAMIDINNSRVLDPDTERELTARFYGHDMTLARLRHGKMEKIKDYEDTLTDPVGYYLDHFGRTSIFRYIQTHPDMDHMTGLYRLQQEGISITNIWDTHHSVEKGDDPEEWEDTPYDIRDWRLYKKLRKSTDSPKALFLLRDASGVYYTDDGIEIWAPFEHRNDLTEDDDTNQLSYLISIVHGKSKIVLGGDATIDTWQRVYSEVNGELPQVSLLKASHHGRKSGYHWQSVKAMAPSYTIVSVGKLLEKDDAFASYERYSKHGCFSTRFEGTIKAQCWQDGDVWLYNESGERIGKGA